MSEDRITTDCTVTIDRLMDEVLLTFTDDESETVICVDLEVARTMQARLDELLS